MTRLTILLVAAALALAACGDDGERPAPAPAPEPGPVADARVFPDDEFGLADGSVFDAAESPAFAWADAMPGSNERLGRIFGEAPPTVPHGIADLLPITLDENACLECHVAGSDEDGPALPESHLRDLRRSPDEVGDAAAGARHVCVLCHAQASDAVDLPELAPGE